MTALNSFFPDLNYIPAVPLCCHDNNGQKDCIDMMGVTHENCMPLTDDHGQETHLCCTGGTKNCILDSVMAPHPNEYAAAIEAYGKEPEFGFDIDSFLACYSNGEKCPVADLKCMMPMYAAGLSE